MIPAVPSSMTCGPGHLDCLSFGGAERVPEGWGQVRGVRRNPGFSRGLGPPSGPVSCVPDAMRLQGGGVSLLEVS